MESINQVLKDYKLRLQYIENTDLTKIKNLQNGINISQQTLLELRSIIRTHDGFKNEDDEIRFFKHIKPFVFGRLRFFGELQRFVLKYPKADVRNQKKYIRSALKQLHDHKNENLAFWSYVKNKHFQKDTFYFLRNHNQLCFSCEYDVDPQFSTNYDILKAHFVAAELLTKHYNKLLLRLTNRESDPIMDLSLDKIRRWSGSKTDLIELIYAFHYSGVINNGQTEISKLIQVSEKFFNIKLGNPYKTFAEIKARENDQTKFLDSLKQALLNKISADDFKLKLPGK